MKDFKTAYSTFFPLGDATEFVMHVFRVFDLNGDGILDFREFMCGFSVVLRGSVDEKLIFSFRIYDVDGNGFISREEMTQVLSVCIQIQ
jgi:Ca2+-binding EF-hand superfamily protein